MFSLILIILGWVLKLLIMTEICSLSESVITLSVRYPVIQTLPTVLEKKVLASLSLLDMMSSFSTRTIFCCPMRLSEKTGVIVFQNFSLSVIEVLSRLL